MYWQQRKNSQDWRDQIRYFMDHNNDLSVDELRDAFINLSYLYVTEYTNVRLLEDAIMETFGEKGELFINAAVSKTDMAKEISDIDVNDGDPRDILGITLNMLDYIEDNNL